MQMVGFGMCCTASGISFVPYSVIDRLYISLGSIHFRDDVPHLPYNYIVSITEKDLHKVYIR